MKRWLVNLPIAAALTALICWLLLWQLDWLVRPCILKGSPRPANYPSYCDTIGQLPSWLLQFWFTIPVLIFVLSVWAVQRVRKR